MISLQNISKRFASIKAVDDVSFTIERGEVVGFLGPNGAGKSTTMRMITGYLPPSNGKVVIDGADIQEEPVAIKRKIGYLPESAALYTDMEVTDFLRFMARMHGLPETKLVERLKTVVHQCQLQSVLGRKIGDLSKGYRQRVGLAQALIHDPEILILDEPTVGLDPNQMAEIRELIKEIGKSKTILLSTHILSEVVATCQRVIIINEGKIVATGTPQELMAGERNQTTYNVAVRGDLMPIKEELEKLPNFSDLTFHTIQDDLHKFTVSCSDHEDHSEQIFERVVKNNWRLTMLVKEQQTLEDVFKDMTK
jgi:ABC-2 type transport system ATP-binding protein